MKKVWDADAGSLGNGWNQRRSRRGKVENGLESATKIYGGVWRGGLFVFFFFRGCGSFVVVVVVVSFCWGVGSSHFPDLAFDNQNLTSLVGKMQLQAAG